MLKKNTLIVALIAALPALAQEAAPQQPGPRAPHWGAAGEMPAPQKGRADMHKRMLEKFDANKDGQISDEEKAAMKEQFGKRGARPEGKRPEGMRPEGKRPEGMRPGMPGNRAEGVHPGNRRRPHNERPEMIEKFDTDKDGKLSEEEKAALKAEFGKRRAERGDRGPRPEGGRRDGKRRSRGERPEAPVNAPTTLEL